MKDKLKSRIATAVVVVATVVLAGVAVFTAMRLYKLRGEPVAPTAPTVSEAASGWEECRIGTPTHNVNSCRQKAEDFKGVAGPWGQDDNGWYTWALSEPKTLSGDTACGLAPTACNNQTASCQELAFTISEPSATPTGSTAPTATSTPTPTSTPTSTSTPTPTDKPRGGSDPTPTTQPADTPTPTDVPQTSTSTPTPTDTQIADSGTQAGISDETAELPEAGVSAPTIIAISLGILLVFFSLVLAL